jgi:carbonic anhydrase/acetyltransferase-like protein (isoleucine patch superfamily)
MGVAYRFPGRENTHQVRQAFQPDGQPRKANVQEIMSGANKFRKELVDPTAQIAPGAIVLGDVTIGAESSIWFNAVVRGDTEAIRIGCRTNVQDLCMLHADPGFPCVLGDRVTVGHSAIIHGATVEDDCMIGMRAVVMNGARIGKGSLVGVGAVVTEGTEVPPGSVVMGVPGKVRREVTAADRQRMAGAALHYVTQAKKLQE